MKQLILLLIFILLGATSCEKDEVEEPSVGNLVINEVYTWSPQKEIEDLDFIELYNGTDSTVDISGFKIWEAKGREEAFTFPSNTIIGSKQLLLIESDKDLLYDDTINYPQWGLSKGPDEKIVLADNSWSIIDSIACPSLKEFESYGRITDGAEEWVIFAQYTKNTANGGEERQPVVNSIGLHINEVFTNNQDDKTYDWDDTKDFIELYNASDIDIDLSGYKMNDDAKKEAKEFTFPDGSIVPAKSFLVFDVYKEKDGPQPENVPVFGLGKSGDWVFIWDTEGVLLTEIEIPAVEDEQIESVGRKTDGGDEVVFFSEVSKGESNNGKANHN